LKKQNLTILIDEPELNMSIFWQKTFLPDILQSGNVRFLLATTHSPFIFEDKSVQFNTVALSAYIEPSKPLVLQ
jgi:predicted ATPase